ncbi:hypothetical protein K1T71_008903 [Dendrolimus kikuchii]|uniref:Uncharacterized protein n=1 Tax=Dendrolimus kikuchii TaxID=765133 RepID=A0ACC1CVL9_9NEOP|nr:hypothetical protein K1T71_008903 [Dendrolimus kikuchii]
MSNKNKSSPDFKEIAKARIASSDLMKIPLYERNKFEKENLNPVFIQTIRRKPLKVHDREPRVDKIRNPYHMPNHMRLFSRRETHKKVTPIPFIMSEPHTICDIDETFYKVIEGRPLRQLDDIKVYMRNIRDITLFRANTAYLKDQIIQVDTYIVDELNHCEKIFDYYLECKTNFVQFAKQSYDVAKNIQMIAEEKATALANVVESLESYSFRYVKLKNEMSAIAAVLETLSRYRSFLVDMSPVTWQNLYNKPKPMISICIEPVDEATTSSSTMSLDFYKKGVEEQLPAKLYFKRPAQMIQIFDDMSKQCLNYMQIKVFTNDILNSVLKSHNKLKVAILDEVFEMEGFIDIYKNYIKWMEGKEIEYKKIFFRIIESDFQKLYASYDNIKLLTCIQYVHNHIFMETEDAKDSAFTLMLHLESLYIDLTSGLDNLDQEVVKQAKTEMFSEDIKTMRRAFKAQRTIRECDILKKALYTSFEPPRRNTKK